MAITTLLKEMKWQSVDYLDMISRSQTWRCLRSLNDSCFLVYSFSTLWLRDPISYMRKVSDSGSVSVYLYVCLCFQWFLSDIRSPLLGNRSSSNLVVRLQTLTFVFSKNIIMVALTINNQARNNELQLIDRQGKQFMCPAKASNRVELNCIER